MPTPRDSIDQLPALTEQSVHTTCPPDFVRSAGPGLQPHENISRHEIDVDNSTSESIGVREDSEQHDVVNNTEERATHPIIGSSTPAAKPDNAHVYASMAVNDAMSPMVASNSPTGFALEDGETAKVHTASGASSALDLPVSSRLGVSSIRLIQTQTCTMLRSGSTFRGTQQSDLQRYNVEVNIQTVDMGESSICGYLKIEGLTPEHPSLTTFFEGEIIGSKYTFQTRHSDWGATDKDDMRAWARFPAWRAVGKQAKKSADFHYKNSTNRENMFMRWKEKFLVPDHRVREINGASFEGFYYICFNQVLGTITGIYYHSKTDSSTNNKVQQLELKWVNDHGHCPAMEFR